LVFLQEVFVAFLLMSREDVEKPIASLNVEVNQCVGKPSSQSCGLPCHECFLELVSSIIQYLGSSAQDK
jgi:hypothetical protein